ncbi:hypothetical protein ACUN90_29600, partial [Escherichia sp. SP-MK2]
MLNCIIAVIVIFLCLVYFTNRHHFWLRGQLNNRFF